MKPFRSHILLLTGCILFVAAINPFNAAAQFNVKLVVTNYVKLHSSDDVFLAGNFNNWHPGNKQYKLSKENGKLVFNLKHFNPAVLEFKFTRGSWDKVAVSSTGADLQNHLVVVKSDTTVYFDISAWKDDFAPEQKKHTASANVHVLDTAFRMPQLGRNRRITVYLPPGYHKSGLRYPVLYMHDGQNLFDEYTSGFGEWGVDETLDSLIAKGRKACIVVGIDNGPQRLTEYNPFYFERFGAGEGDAYLKFLTATLKPFIDFKYRTLPTKENTIIAGSSMGGLISYYAFLKYPRVFGKAGVFSPAFWTADSIYHFTDSLGKDVSGMAFFYMGGLEGGSYVEEMQKVADQLGEQSQAYVFTVIDPEGRHNEASWKKWFAEFYQWIVKDGNNHIVTPDD